MGCTNLSLSPKNERWWAVLGGSGSWFIKKCFYWGPPKTPCCSWGASSPPDTLRGGLQSPCSVYERLRLSNCPWLETKNIGTLILDFWKPLMTTGHVQGYRFSKTNDPCFLEAPDDRRACSRLFLFSGKMTLQKQCKYLAQHGTEILSSSQQGLLAPRDEFDPLVPWERGQVEI